MEKRVWELVLNEGISTKLKVTFVGLNCELRFTLKPRGTIVKHRMPRMMKEVQFKAEPGGQSISKSGFVVQDLLVSQWNGFRLRAF